MGSSLSFNDDQKRPPDSPGSTTGFTRIEPSWTRSRDAPKAGTSGTVRSVQSNGAEIPLPEDGRFTLAPSNSTPEILADSNGIQLTDNTSARLELEGTLEINIAEFTMKTRKFVTRGEHGFGIGIDTKPLDPGSFTTVTPEEGGTVLLQAQKDLRQLRLRIRTNNKKIRIVIDPVNTCGVVWIRFLTHR